jgi:F-type H+-transporting ATPase subunit gamma
MSDTLGSLRRKIATAGDLKSVVRSMKSLAASSIGQYEKAVVSLADYERSVELGLSVCWKNQRAAGRSEKTDKNRAIGAIVVGSDQGLVGQFNDILSDYVVKTLEPLPGEKKVWAVGDRIRSRLAETDLRPLKVFNVPTSVNAIAPLIGQILVETETCRSKGEIGELYVFHNRPKTRAVFEPASHRLMPIDRKWADGLAHRPWPARNLPEILGPLEPTLLGFVREFLFVSIFKAVAESLAAENGTRLAAMQRAEKNIDDMVETLNQTFHRLRQASIDEELFDVVSGYESLSNQKRTY